GLTPKATTRMRRPTAPHRPRPTPLERAPIQMAARTTANCRTIDSVISGSLSWPAKGGRSLLELGRDEVLEGEDLVPLLLREELPLRHDDLVQALARLVALARDLGALLVAQRGLEDRHDPEGVEDHVAGALGVGRDPLHAVLAQAGDRVLHGGD